VNFKLQQPDLWYHQSMYVISYTKANRLSLLYLMYHVCKLIAPEHQILSIGSLLMETSTLESGQVIGLAPDLCCEN